ncbi:hypothetical protein LIV37_31200 [Streptomyces rapamycinicus NRRL 5491]|uniref:Pimeloyl-ACP methyl ester carboxylesterase n=1 Tax=Streptomyces rapamycinicus TaxID=1226757 RepID=A0ABR6LUI1_9ACTN|nr:hypothetical protein [Streptomyces rapamycinicus]MBB4785238.1 pimeloyl-ACP methyl ester carboxylesterase [Streptomyces rapamycinicus]UTP33404.1 hypothetical protein LIV37_31200 [Streptomyces rapamycinicus NRRL 5491]
MPHLEVELSAGTIEYEDTGGEGPVAVLLHGVAMDGSLWREVVAALAPDVRRVVPTLPLGGHRPPMRPDADLSVLGVARLNCSTGPTPRAPSTAPPWRPGVRGPRHAARARLAPGRSAAPGQPGGDPRQLYPDPPRTSRAPWPT